MMVQVFVYFTNGESASVMLKGDVKSVRRGLNAEGWFVDEDGDLLKINLENVAFFLVSRWGE